MVMSWDLGIPMKRRRLQDGTAGRRERGRWEAMTGWGDSATDDEADDGDDHPVGDGDILGDVTVGRRPASLTGEIPHERRWETDLTSFQAGTVRGLSLFTARD